LINQWKSSLIGLKKRDEMLQEIENAIKKNNESLSIMKTEIHGFKRTLGQAQEEGESLSNLLSKLESEAEYIKKQQFTTLLNRFNKKKRIANNYNNIGYKLKMKWLL